MGLSTAEHVEATGAKVDYRAQDCSGNAFLVSGIVGDIVDSAMMDTFESVAVGHDGKGFALGYFGHPGVPEPIPGFEQLGLGGTEGGYMSLIQGDAGGAEADLAAGMGIAEYNDIADVGGLDGTLAFSYWIAPEPRARNPAGRLPQLPGRYRGHQ